ncbi:MAG: cell division protein ZapD [Gammaproteobacteria bacterium]|nr:cell division protein ZapD [Gammaproteobacteria bacterium]
MPKYIVYEQPQNERIKKFLRLEYLFDQMAYHERGGSSWDSAAALSGLLDIKTLFSRSDLKIEIVKELDRQIATLGKLVKNPEVNREQLDKTLKEFEGLANRLYALPAQQGSKRNEFLYSIQQKDCMTGGACISDLPIYHFWLMQPPERRRQDLLQWQQGFDVIRQAIELILRTIRDSGSPQEKVAASGFFQHTPDANTQLIRILLTEGSPYFTEMSGGKHRFSVTFMKASLNERSEKTSENIEFQLSCCML